MRRERRALSCYMRRDQWHYVRALLAELWFVADVLCFGEEPFAASPHQGEQVAAWVINRDTDSHVLVLVFDFPISEHSQWRIVIGHAGIITDVVNGISQFVDHTRGG